MAIMRKGPGGPGKVASKMTKTSTSKLKNVFTNVSNKIKAEKAGRDQLKKYQESLKQKKLAEQKAQKDLQLKERGGRKGKMSVAPETIVKGKQKKTYGGYKQITQHDPKDQSKSTYFASAKSIPSDSAKFMQQMKNISPQAYNAALGYMQKQQAKTPGARFEFGGVKSVSGDIVSRRPGEKPQPVPGKKGQYQYSVPTIRTVLPNKKKK